MEKKTTMRFLGNSENDGLIMRKIMEKCWLGQENNASVLTTQFKVIMGHPDVNIYQTVKNMSWNLGRLR